MINARSNGRRWGMQKFYVVTFSDIMNMINGKLCMIVGPTEFYPVKPLSGTLTAFQDYSISG